MRSCEDGPVHLVVGGRLCLDFVNTVSSWGAERPRDDLASPEAVLRWGWQMGLYPEPQLTLLLAHARAHPGEARRLVADAGRLRTALYRIFTADAPAPPEVETLGHFVAQARRAEHLVPGRPWKWELAPSHPLDLRLPLLHVALSAAGLLTSEALARVKSCPLPDGGCGWLFLDETKNGTRRWCSMAHCGSRAKSRRFAARARSDKAAPLA